MCFVCEAPIMISQTSVWKLLMELCCSNRGITLPSLTLCLPTQTLMHPNMHMVRSSRNTVSVNVAKLMEQNDTKSKMV